MRLTIAGQVNPPGLQGWSNDLALGGKFGPEIRCWTDLPTGLLLTSTYASFNRYRHKVVLVPGLVLRFLPPIVQGEIEDRRCLGNQLKTSLFRRVTVSKSGSSAFLFHSGLRTCQSTLRI